MEGHESVEADAGDEQGDSSEKLGQQGGQALDSEEGIEALVYGLSSEGVVMALGSDDFLYSRF